VHVEVLVKVLVAVAVNDRVLVKVFVITGVFVGVVGAPQPFAPVRGSTPVFAVS
jgi:hypothetical protein